MKEKLYNLFLQHRIWYYVIGTVGGLLILDLWVSIFINAFTESINFNGFFANGAFQLYNPLRRLADGQILGHDFQFFHGIGVLLFHYPLFKLLGANLFAAEMARHILSPTVFIITNFIFFLIITRKKSVSLFLTVVTAFLAIKLHNTTFYAVNAMVGIRSAMPIIIASILILIINKCRSKDQEDISLKNYLIISLLLVIAFFISIENGLASLGAYVIVHIMVIHRLKVWKKSVKKLLFVFVAYLFFVITLFFIVSGRYLLEPIRYALIDIPFDQFWYFGAPPNSFISSLHDLIQFKDIIVIIGIGLLLMIVSIINVYKQRNYAEDLGILYLLLCGLLSSSIALLGIVHISYLHPLMRIEILAILWYGAKLLLFLWEKILVMDSPKYRIWYKALIILSIAIAISVTFKALDLKIPNIFQDLENVVLATPPQKEKYLGVYLSPSWLEHRNMISRYIEFPIKPLTPQPLTDINWDNGIGKKWPGFFVLNTKEVADVLKPGRTLKFTKSGLRTIIKAEVVDKWLNVYVDGSILDPIKDGYPNIINLNQSKNANNNPILWSTYAGITEAELGIYNPSSDYIIHALGPKRRLEYEELFKQTKPNFVRTTNDKYFWGYGKWLQNTSWNFYEQVFSNYDIVGVTYNGVLWKKVHTENWKDTKEWEGIINNPKQKKIINIPVNLSKSQNEILVLNVKYKIKNTWNWIPVVGKLPRHMIIPRNAVSAMPVTLPPYWNEINIPLVVDDKSKPYLELVTESIVPRAEFNVTEIKYRYLKVVKKTKEYIMGTLE